MTFEVRLGVSRRLFANAVSMRVLGLALIALLVPATELVAQPLEWSPNRIQRSRSPRSLQSLAAEASNENRAPMGLLIRNPNSASDGTAPYAVADEFGRVQRFVEPSPGIDLASYVGERVRVRRDTGETLLASQLDLPMIAGPDPGMENLNSVQQAEYYEPAPTRDDQIVRTASVQPVVVQEGGFVGGAPGCNCPQCQSVNCPQCEVNHYGTPITGGMIMPYNGCNNCQTCQPYVTQSYQPSCCKGSRGRFYGRAEYLRWWFDGYHVPPLVTSSPAGTPQAEAGVLGQPDTTILFGNGEIMSDGRNGLRFLAGMWVNDYQDIGIEGDILLFNSESLGFSRTGVNGVPILARPFFNMVPVNGAGDVLPPAEDAELVSFPGVVDGTVSVHANSDFGGAGLRMRAAMCCQELGSACNSCNPCGPVASPWGVSRIDVIAGYRYLKLDDRLLIRENLNSLLSTDPGSFDITDRFDTSNKFHGGDVGFIWEWESQKWSIEFLTKVAIGNTDQRANIRGSTTVSNNGASFTNEGGLLALRSNSGSYQRDVFSVVPEIGLTLGYRITPRLRATAGYTLLYWSRVVRPGELIDLDVNPNLLPPVVEPVVGPERPRFEWEDTALVAHGLNLGLDYRF